LRVFEIAVADDAGVGGRRTGGMEFVDAEGGYLPRIPYANRVPLSIRVENSADTEREQALVYAFAAGSLYGSDRHEGGAADHSVGRRKARSISGMVASARNCRRPNHTLPGSLPVQLHV
jgi:hypothetical protein